ncbi:MBOAT family O-acyltransferase [Novosphingobium sp.]|uniref:MBOAT family O-acyltransferase n=1 Tax=Novosphingobium sp. TaxID=1874826 RepID=UPI00262D837D|nr:MBOAT family O-acyltransferase [Novosphingobium sp.]
MQFNSAEYILVFLPLLLLAYHGLAARLGTAFRQLLLIAATLVFYAWGGPKFVPLLLGSMVLNYAAAQIIQRTATTPARQHVLLLLAVAANVIFLGYFKYLNFLADIWTDLAGGTLRVENIALPLGISFFTFQQIGFLVEVSRGRQPAGKPLDYASFVLFFPQILAGPITQYAEIVPHLRERMARGTVAPAIQIGLALFAIGLFKKTVIADTLSLYAAPSFAAAREGGALGLLDTWMAAFAYTAQVYFDFSGYSDMAIGTARMFGLILPLNFHSPLRAQSVVEIWRRWHVTLGRWIQAYVFQPISIPLARRAAMAGYGKWGTHALSVVAPTMISMLIVGVWHGAGWTFVVFGLMQGTYMSVNETWTALRRKARKGRKGPRASWKIALSRTATTLAFVLSIIPFGQPTLAAANRMFAAMVGAGDGLLVTSADWPLGAGAAFGIVALCYASLFVVPNSHQIMDRFEPVLEWSTRWRKLDPSGTRLVWQMTPGWAVATGAVLFLGFAFIMRGTATFIYFNF